MGVLPFAFILGICVGSFLNVCIDRLPQGQSIIKPPSYCPGCSKRLRPFDLIPVVSYLWLRGRCRYCGMRIPRRILVVELGTGLFLTFLCFSYGLSIEFLILSVYTCLFLLLAIIDLEQGLVLNKIVYPGICISLVLAPFWSQTALARSFLGSSSMVASFTSSVVAGGALLIVFLLVALAYKAGMGLGDVKMAGLVGLAVGISELPVALLTSVISGALVAGLLLLLGIKRRNETIPFAPFLSLGALTALLWGKEITQWYLGLMGIG